MVVTLISQRLRERGGRGAQSQELRGNIQSCRRGGNIPVRMRKTRSKCAVSNGKFNPRFRAWRVFQIWVEYVFGT